VVSQAISHYRIIKKLGAGGMGEVYLAEDTKLNRKVAVKVIRANSDADEQAKNRLIREAHAAARLDHPNICAIHEVGEADGESFIVMQYVEGETLADRIDKKPLDLRESLDVAVQVADALSEAHSQGIIHRDIKPQNIMLTLRGQAKMMDFGLAKVIQQKSVIDSEVTTHSLLTEPGVLVGTVPYLSPEQVRGDTADGRSDIFSFGTMLYKMVTGIHPFAAESNGATISAILTREPPPLARYAANVPTELERVQHKCLEKDRERRYQSALEVLVDLRTLQRRLESAVTIETVLSRRKSSTRRLVVVALVAAIIAIIGAGLFFFAFDDKTGKAIGSVAVLPFVNVGADPSTEYLSDGITDGLINSLSQLPNLKVIARSSVFRYKGQEADPQTVGRNLKVLAVLTGRVHRLDDTLSVSAELADARDNSHIWGAQYNRKLSDVLALQEEISKEISEKLQLKLSGEEAKLLAKRYTEDNEAYQLYMKGRYFWNKRTPEDVKRGIEQFKQALDKDPRYALAYSGLADSYAMLGDYGIIPPKEVFPSAAAAATRALEIDDKLAEAHTSLAHARLYDWDWSSADREYKRAIELKPGYATAHQWYANHLVATGHFNEALIQIRRALELDPLSLIINEGAGLHLYLTRKYDQAIEQQQKTLELDSSFIPAHSTLGAAYLQKGMYEQALAEFQKAIDLSGHNPDYVADLGHGYAVSGKRGKARKVLDELNDMSKLRHVSPYAIARVYVGLGESDQAFKWLEKAYGERTSELIFIKEEPVFDNLHLDLRFQDLLKRMGLVP
jgi:serine/threonine protein kinase/Tfp pilus assembly protein PilF